MKFIKKRKKLVVLLILVVVAIVAYIIYSSAQRKIQEDLANNTSDSSVVLEKRELAKSITLTGTVVSEQKLVVSSNTIGVDILEVLVKVGDQVKAGDVLVKLDSSVIEAKLEAEKKNLDIAKAKTNIDINTAQRGLDGAVGNLDSDYKKAEAGVYDANIAMQRANESLNRVFSSQDTINSNIKNKQDELNGAQTKLTNSRNAYNAKNGQLTNIQNIIANAEADKTSAEAAKQAALAEITRIDNDTSIVDPNEKANLKAVQQAIIDASDITINNATTLINDNKLLLDPLAAELKGYAEDMAAKEATVATANAALEAAKSQLASTEAERRAAEEAQISAASSINRANIARDDTGRQGSQAVDNAKAGVNSASISAGTIGLAESINIEAFERQIKDCTIIAPYDGVITSVPVIVGKRYEGGELMTIQDVSGYKIQAYADQYDISDIASNMEAIITTKTTGDTKMNGNITFVAPTPQSQVGTTGASTTLGYEVLVDIKDPSDRLRLGMTAKTEIILKKESDSFVVPYTHIVKNEDGEDIINVEVTEEGMPATNKQIKIQRILETDYYVAIRGEGLEEGMKIILPVSEDSGVVEATSASADSTK